MGDKKTGRRLDFATVDVAAEAGYGREAWREATVSETHEMRIVAYRAPFEVGHNRVQYFLIYNDRVLPLDIHRHADDVIITPPELDDNE